MDGRSLLQNGPFSAFKDSLIAYLILSFFPKRHLTKKSSFACYAPASHFSMRFLRNAWPQFRGPLSGKNSCFLSPLPHIFGAWKGHWNATIFQGDNCHISVLGTRVASSSFCSFLCSSAIKGEFQKKSGGEGSSTIVELWSLLSLLLFPKERIFKLFLSVLLNGLLNFWYISRFWVSSKMIISASFCRKKIGNCKKRDAFNPLKFRIITESCPHIYAGEQKIELTTNVLFVGFTSFWVTVVMEAESCHYVSQTMLRCLLNYAL